MRCSRCGVFFEFADFVDPVLIEYEQCEMRSIQFRCRLCDRTAIVDLPSDAVTADATVHELRTFLAGYFAAERGRVKRLEPSRDAPQRELLRPASGLAATVAATVIVTELYSLARIADLSTLIQALLIFVISSIIYHLNT